MQNTGKVFETAIKKSVDKIPDCYYQRIQDNASSFGQSSNLRFTLSNPYDSFIYKYPNFYPLELKSSKTTSFSFQRDKKDNSKNIKLHQIEGLTKASEVTGVLSGFLFNFSEKPKTYWMNIVDFNRFYNSTEKLSINEKDMIEFGAVEVKHKLLRTTYEYDIDGLLKEIS